MERQIEPLKFIEPSEILPAFSILLYGTPGTGKTVGACSAPGPILYINADRQHAASKARAIHGPEKIREVKFEGSETFDQVIAHLRSGSDEKTIVVDTVGDVYEDLVQESAAKNVGKAAGLVSIDNYLFAQKKIEEFVKLIGGSTRSLVLICHEQIDDSEVEVTRRPMTGGQKLPEKLMGKVDVVAFTSVLPPEEEGGERRYVGQLIEGNGRRAKDGGLGLGPRRELNLTDWIQDGAKNLATADPAPTKKGLKAA